MDKKPKIFRIKQQALILTVKPDGAIAKTTRKIYRENGFNSSFIEGLLLQDPKRKSKIVMESWTNYFKNNPNPKYFSQNRPALYSEDDVYNDYTPKYCKAMAKKYPNKVIWLCYQKTFKEKGKDIPVGSQVILIPNEKVYKEFRDLIMKAKPIHYDRWLSRQELVVRPTPPKHMCAEIEGASITVGTRKGKALSSALEQKDLQIEVKYTEDKKKIKRIKIVKKK